MGKYPRKLGRKTWQMFHRPVWDRTLGRLGSVRMWGKKSCEKGPVEVDILVSLGFCCLF